MRCLTAAACNVPNFVAQEERAAAETEGLEIPPLVWAPEDGQAEDCGGVEAGDAGGTGDEEEEEEAAALVADPMDSGMGEAQSVAVLEAVLGLIPLLPEHHLETLETEVASLLATHRAD